MSVFLRLDIDFAQADVKGNDSLEIADVMMLLDSAFATIAVHTSIYFGAVGLGGLTNSGTSAVAQGKKMANWKEF